MSEVVEQEVVEAAPAEGETESTESAAGEQQEPQDGAPKGVQKRIDKAVKAQREAEREREFWKQEALKAKPAVETPKEIPKGKPSENDFQTHAEYIEALTDWKLDQKFAASRQADVAEKVKTHQQKANEDFKVRQEAFRAATPDFDEVLADADDIQVSNAVLAEVIESDHGPELQYYLAKNPEEAKRLSTLTSLALAREVGKIESRFTTSEQSTAPKTTTAPPPPKPGSKSTATSTKDPGEMNPREYADWRAKQK